MEVIIKFCISSILLCKPIPFKPQKSCINYHNSDQMQGILIIPFIPDWLAAQSQGIMSDYHTVIVGQTIVVMSRSCLDHAFIMPPLKLRYMLLKQHCTKRFQSNYMNGCSNNRVQIFTFKWVFVHIMKQIIKLQFILEQ